MEAEIATGEDGNERSIECLSLIDAACYDVVRKGASSGAGAAGAASAPVAGSSIGPLDGSGYGCSDIRVDFLLSMTKQKFN